MIARQLALLALLALLAGTYAVDAGQCDDTSCRSSDGNDCCSAKNFGDETMRCENDLTPVRTTTECSDGAGWVYQCCNQTAKVLASGECDELRCSSLGDDCCAGADEAQTCRDGLQPFLTGRRCWAGTGNTYTCCNGSPVPAGECSDAYCDSSIGNDCCSAKNFGEETMRCSAGLTPVRTTTECSNGDGWVYQCCNQTAKVLASGECDELRCSSNGDDCCAGADEVMACRDGLTSRPTGEKCFFGLGNTYTCCNGAVEPKGPCDESKCSSPGNDCCAGPGESKTCKDGLLVKDVGQDCAWGLGKTYTCCHQNAAGNIGCALESRFLVAAIMLVVTFAAR